MRPRVYKPCYHFIYLSYPAVFTVQQCPLQRYIQHQICLQWVLTGLKTQTQSQAPKQRILHQALVLKFQRHQKAHRPFLCHQRCLQAAQDLKRTK